MDPVVKQNIMSLYKVDSAAKGDQASQGFDIKVSQKLPALTIPDEEIAISLDDFIAVLVEKGDEYVAHGKEDLAAFAVKTEALHFVVEVTRAPKVASILLEDITETLKNAILTLVNKAQKDTSYESSQPMAVDTEELQRHFAAISNAARSPNTVTEADLGRIVSDLLDWAKKHPWQVAFHLTCAILLLSPGIVVGPILGYIGFSSEGVVAGKLVDTLNLTCASR